MQCSVFVACSLDGFIADSTGSLDWLDACTRPDEDYGFSRFLASVDALAMGRRTYEHIAHIKPLPFDGKPVHVFTHHPPEARAGVRFCECTPEQAVAHWVGEGFQRVYVDGGALVSSFLAAGLIDDLTVTFAPVLLGQGIPLIVEGVPITRLSQVSMQQWPSGMLQVSYQVLRD